MMERYEDPQINAAMGGCLHPGGLALTAKAVSLGAFSPGARILDIGAGYGETVAYLREKWQLDAVGLEPSTVLRENALAAHPGLPLVAGCGEEIPFPDQNFDGIVMECVFSQFPDPVRVLAEVSRVLRPGGTIVISDLYLKEGQAGSWLCGKHLRWRREFEALLDEFQIVHFSDESAALAALVVDMIWRGFAPKALFGENSCLGETKEGRQGKPGYFLLLAKKEEERCRRISKD